jgi:hypothetical protein
MMINRIEGLHQLPVQANTLYYFRLLHGQRVLFRRQEIRSIQRGIGGVILTTWTGYQYTITSEHPEKVEREILT